ncbi:hypothetical protein KFZ70_08115 [Tamlana fucoidanivorans]|uniref:hypothetical protein n=1 Tax=Allotamlana fucoidanivorans TaxID=2583814 RepID=UPI00130522F1|nr:hypothetical protein [Tamlana fucoidanivorans]
MKQYKEPALALGLDYSYSADDKITYIRTYKGKTVQEIKVLEREVLTNQIQQVRE